MHPVKTALMAATLMVGLPAAANAQWYVGADTGANYMEDPGHGTDSDWSWAGLAEVGYDFGGPKVEFEAGYRHNDDIAAYSTMVNGVYSFLSQYKWHPFVGAGIGWAWLDGNFHGAGRENSDNSFAYQGMVGVSYDLTPSLALKAQYRYFATADADVGPAEDTSSDYRNHSLLLGVTYKLPR